MGIEPPRSNTVMLHTPTVPPTSNNTERPNSIPRSSPAPNNFLPRHPQQTARIDKNNPTPYNHQVTSRRGSSTSRVSPPNAPGIPPRSPSSIGAGVPSALQATRKTILQTWKPELACGAVLQTPRRRTGGDHRPKFPPRTPPPSLFSVPDVNGWQMYTYFATSSWGGPGRRTWPYVPHREEARGAAFTCSESTGGTIPPRAPPGCTELGLR